MMPMSLAELARLPNAGIDRVRARAGALELPRDKSVAVLRYDDVAAAFANPELTVRHRFRATLRLFGPTIFDTDGPDHRRQRTPVVRGLADGKADLIDTGEIGRIAAAAVASLCGRPAVELVGDLAVPVATGTMAHLTGLSSAEALHLYTLYRPVERIMTGDASALDEAQANLREAFGIYAARRHRPAAGHPSSLTRAMNDAVENARLSASELDRHQLINFLAGVETTVCALSNTLWMLMTEDRLLPRLRELSGGQIGGAVAEMLRHQPPLFSTVRFALSPLDLCGVVVKAGTPVHLCLGPACRDPDKFPQPHRLKLTRRASTNLMFGHGSHFCAGTVIAKEELNATVKAIIDEIDDLRPLDDPPPPIEGHYFRRPRALHASIGWAA